MINNSRKTTPYNLKIGYFAQVRPVTDSVEVGNPEIILATSGESFFWARRFLGKKMGHDAARLYSFCRVLDDMADGDIENGPEHLVNIQNSLNQGDWENNRFLQQFSGLVSEYNFSPDVISSLIEGLMDDQAPKVLIENEEQLIQYAYKVAGTVGLLMCGVLNTDEHRAKAHAVDLGIGMQLTNIARDVVVDAKMGRRYLPGEWVNNMSPEEILVAAETRPAIMDWLSLQQSRGFLHLQRSTMLVEELDYRIFLLGLTSRLELQQKYTVKLESSYCAQRHHGMGQNRSHPKRVRFSAH